MAGCYATALIIHVSHATSRLHFATLKCEWCLLLGNQWYSRVMVTEVLLRIFLGSPMFPKVIALRYEEGLDC